MALRSSIKPSQFGLVFALAWSYCMTSGIFPGNKTFIALSYFSAMAISLVAFAWFVGSKRIGKPLEAASDILSGIGLASAALLEFFPVPAFEKECALMGAVLAGGGVTWSYMRLSSFYARFDLRKTITLVFLSAAFSSAVKIALDLLPDAADAAVLVGIAACLTTCLRLTDKTQDATEKPRRFYNRRTLAPLWHLAAGVAVFSLVLGLLQATILAEKPQLYPAAVLFHHGTEIVLAIVTLLWATTFNRGLNFSRNWRLVLMLMTAMLILYGDLPEPYSNMLLALVRTAQTFLVVFLLLALVDIARHSTFDPMVVFALGWTSYAIPHASGLAAGTLLSAAHEQFPVTLSLFALLLIFVTLFLLDETSVGNHILFSELYDTGEDNTAARLSDVQEAIDAEEKRKKEHEGGDRIDFKCAILAEKYELTPREREILALLAHGRSKAYIADAFIISENTVRGHVKRLYAKLDIHSKQELLDRVHSVRY